MCDAMDCKHIKPMDTVLGCGPYLGYCTAPLVNIFYHEERKCLTYEDKGEGDVDTDHDGE